MNLQPLYSTAFDGNPNLVLLQVLGDILVGVTMVLLGFGKLYLMWNSHKRKLLWFSFTLLFFSLAAQRFMAIYAVFHSFTWELGWTKVVTGFISILVFQQFFAAIPDLQDILQPMHSDTAVVAVKEDEDTKKSIQTADEILGHLDKEIATRINKSEGFSNGSLPLDYRPVS